MTVIVMLAVVTMMLARLANRSLTDASAALEAESKLRNRWAVTSLRRFSLNAAPDLLRDSQPFASDSETADLAQAVRWKNVDLGGNTWRVVIADESAKAHLPRLEAQRDMGRIEQMAEDLLSGRNRLQLTSRLKRATDRDYQRWERWLRQGISDPIDDPLVLAVATQRLTLWGDGKLNIRRCEKETLDHLWRELFGRAAPGQLHEIRARKPAVPFGRILRTLGLRESQAELARQWMTDESTCFSVWLLCRTDRRVSPSLFVKWGSNDRSAEHRGYIY